MKHTPLENERLWIDVDDALDSQPFVYRRYTQIRPPAVPRARILRVIPARTVRRRARAPSRLRARSNNRASSYLSRASNAVLDARNARARRARRTLTLGWVDARSRRHRAVRWTDARSLGRRRIEGVHSTRTREMQGVMRATCATTYRARATKPRGAGRCKAAAAKTAGPPANLERFRIETP